MSIISDILWILGCIAVSIGAYACMPAAGIIVFGALAMVTSVMLSRGIRDDEDTS